MSVIYNSKILLKTGSGYPGTVLDLGEAGYDISSNKFWLGNGIGNVPTGIAMDPSLNYLWSIVNNLESSSGNYATQIYVDGSLSLRDVSIEWLNSNKVNNASLGLYATNASVNLAIAPLATNASVNIALGAYATNASVNLAIAPLATNASVGLSLSKYIPNASLGLDFYWQLGLLEVSVGSILTPGKNLTYDGSGNLAVVNSPNFSGDVSIQQRLFVDQNIQLKDFTLSNASTGQLWWQSPRLFFRDETTNRDILQGSLKGTSYPVSPSEGDMFYRSDIGLLFIYDGSRGKYLSASRSTIAGGRTTAVAGSTVYVRVGDATQSSTAGYRMIRNGTITGFSVDNNNTLTAARDVQVRINDVSSLTRTIAIGQKGFNYNQANVDFSAGDLLQVSTLPGGTGSALNNWIILIEFATRA